MNILLFDASELEGDILHLADGRARHILQVLRLQPGDHLRLGQINGSLGTGIILYIQGDQVSLRVLLESTPPPPPTVSLVVALPRPIMVQRILKQATTLGVAQIHFIRSHKVERSYLQSPVLHIHKIKEMLIQGLTQARDTRLPQVSIHPYFKPFVNKIVPSLPTARLLAHPGSGHTLASLFRDRPLPRRLVMAIGPEGGWNDYELRQFSTLGFTPFSMGSRILHVDTTVVALLAQCQLLHDLANR